jgi:hypothetical protein
MYKDEETSSLFSIIIMANMTLFLSQRRSNEILVEESSN